MDGVKGFKFKLVLHKRYFDVGLGLTGYAKYAIALFGIASADVKTTLIIAFIYAIVCYFAGMYWIKSRFYELEQEVSNIYNRFVREMRKRKI